MSRRLLLLKFLTQLMLWVSLCGQWIKNAAHAIKTLWETARLHAQHKRYGIKLDKLNNPVFPPYRNVSGMANAKKRATIDQWEGEKKSYIDWIAIKQADDFAQEKRNIKAEGWWAKLLRYRWFWVLAAGVISINLFFFGVDFLNLYPTLNLQGGGAAGWATLISILVSSPVLYVVWAYRDQNNLWQIDNSRKDINLKDFQKLAEWASGQHFEPTDPEPQTTNTGASKPLSEPTEKNTSSINKAHGAEALQVAAIYQLIAFLDGEFGKHFQRPAFQLLKSIWERYSEALIPLQPKTETTPTNQEDGIKIREDWEIWRGKINAHMRLPLGRALHQALISRGGLRLSGYAEELPGTTWMGLDAHQPGMNGLRLAKLNLNGINLQGADLSWANLHGADLSWANLHGADLSWANLHGAVLIEANLHGADLSRAKLHGAVLIKANLHGADLRRADLHGAVLIEAKLHGADLRRAELHGANLREAELHGADLIGANLHGAVLRGVEIDASTQLSGAIINAHTQFGRLREGIGWWGEAKDEDWIEGDAIRAEWIDRGAVEAIEPAINT